MADTSRLTRLIGKDIIRKTWDATHWFWCACQQAQELNPMTGAPLLDSQGIVYTAEGLLAEVKIATDQTKIILDSLDGYLAKMDSQTIANGVAGYGLALSDITSDIGILKPAHSAFVGNSRFTANKAQLKLLGKASVINDWMIDKIPISTVETDQDDFHCNCAHASLEALYLELMGIDIALGTPKVMPEELMQEFISSRVFVAVVEARASQNKDAPTILAIAEWILANRNADRSVIANHINTNIGRLPLVRRHWAI